MQPSHEMSHLQDEDVLGIGVGRERLRLRYPKIVCEPPAGLPEQHLCATFFGVR